MSISWLQPCFPGSFETGCGGHIRVDVHVDACIYGISCLPPLPPSQGHQLMLDLTTEKLGRLEVLERRCIRADEVPTARERGGGVASWRMTTAPPPCD